MLMPWLQREVPVGEYEQSFAAGDCAAARPERAAQADLNASIADYQRFKADATSAIAKKEKAGRL